MSSPASMEIRLECLALFTDREIITAVQTAAAEAFREGALPAETLLLVMEHFAHAADAAFDCGGDHSECQVLGLREHSIISFDPSNMDPDDPIWEGMRPLACIIVENAPGEVAVTIDNRGGMRTRFVAATAGGHVAQFAALPVVNDGEFVPGTETVTVGCYTARDRERADNDGD